MLIEARSEEQIGGMGRRLTVLGLPTLALTSAAVSSAMAQSAPTDQTKQQADATTEQLTVTGLRPLVSDKLPTGLQDAPQTINVIDEQLLKDQATTRLEDALRNVPGITFNSGE